MTLYTILHGMACYRLFKHIRNDMEFRSIIDKSSGGSKAIYMLSLLLNYKFFMKFLCKWSQDPQHFSRIYAPDSDTLKSVNCMLIFSGLLLVA